MCPQGAMSFLSWCWFLIIMVSFSSLLWAFPSSGSKPRCGAGFDFGTSGVRLVVLEASETPTCVHQASFRWPHSQTVQDAEEWRLAMFRLLDDIPPAIRSRVARVAISGTSASCVVVNKANGAITRNPRLYNWDALREIPETGRKAKCLIADYAPAKHVTLSGTSSLMKVVSWHLEEAFHRDEVMLHQADFLSACLIHDASTAKREQSCFPRVSDWNNMLKLGYDMSALAYPGWFSPLLDDRLGLGCPSPSESSPSTYRDVLPTHIIEPGQPNGCVSPSLVQSHGFPSDCMVVGGTTDSVAAFIAAGLQEPGQAVTSLGSTLAIKMLSNKAVEDATRGVYSHRLGNQWLVGGASNVGCAVLRQEGFSNPELERLSQEIDPRKPCRHLNYYPLAGDAGERFPSCDPSKKALLTPRPPRRSEYLQGILEGIARVERDGYQILKDLGADELVEVRTAGGGARNKAWTRIRRQLLGVPTGKASETEASYGAALLALKTLS